MLLAYFVTEDLTEPINVERRGFLPFNLFNIRSSEVGTWPATSVLLFSDTSTIA